MVETARRRRFGGRSLSADRIAVFVLTLQSAACAEVVRGSSQEASDAVDRATEYGAPNPNAPLELSQFAFLIGKWRCESRVKNPDGSFQAYPATWIGRYILDGYVIADEFRQFGPDGALTQLGQNYRSFSNERNTWVMKWHDALASTWLDLGPQDLGGVRVTEDTITFMHHLPPGLPDGLFPSHTTFRVTFSGISDDHFTWTADISRDGGASWEKVQVIEAHLDHDR